MNYPEYPVIDTKAIGARIHDLRVKHKYRVDDISSYMGFGTSQAVYKWQRGDSVPTVDNLLALSKLFGTSVDFILKGDDREEDERASSLQFCRQLYISFISRCIPVVY